MIRMKAVVLNLSITSMRRALHVCQLSTQLCTHYAEAITHAIFDVSFANRPLSIHGYLNHEGSANKSEPEERARQIQTVEGLN